MSSAGGGIPAINGGASSIKFALFATGGGLRMTQCGRIGSALPDSTGCRAWPARLPR